MDVRISIPSSAFATSLCLEADGASSCNGIVPPVKNDVRNTLKEPWYFVAVLKVKMPSYVLVPLDRINAGIVRFPMGCELGWCVV